MNNARYNFGIDVVKIVAIFWIMQYHWIDWTHAWQPGILYSSGSIFHFFNEFYNSFLSVILSILSIGAGGVNLFVIASGIGLTLGAKHLNLQQFYTKRFLRVLVPYWLLLSVILCAYLLQGVPFESIDFLIHFFGLHNLFPQYTYSIGVHLWFVGVILQLYILYPFLFRLYRKVTPGLFITILFLFELLIHPQLIAELGQVRLPTEFLLEFGCGILLAKNKIHLNKSKKVFLFGLWMLTLYLLLSKGQNIVPDIFYQVLIYPFSALSLFVLLASFQKRSLPLKNVAYSSYGIYLVHYLLLIYFIPYPSFLNWCTWMLLSILPVYFVMKYYRSYLLAKNALKQA